MNADKAQLLGLIGLRALAIHDPFEYRRLADLPIPELDRQITVLLKSVRDDDCRKLYDQTINIGSQHNADVLLEEAAESSFRKANLEALKLKPRKRSQQGPEAEKQTRRRKPKLTNPGAVIIDEMRDAGLKSLNPQAEELLAIRFDTDEKSGVLKPEAFEGSFFEVLGDVANTLSNPEMVEGSEKSRTTAMWNICARILKIKGKVLEKKASPEDLFLSARAGKASDWLRQNARDAAPGRTPQRT